MDPDQSFTRAQGHRRSGGSERPAGRRVLFKNTARDSRKNDHEVSQPSLRRPRISSALGSRDSLHVSGDRGEYKRGWRRSGSPERREPAYTRRARRAIHQNGPAQSDGMNRCRGCARRCGGRPRSCYRGVTGALRLEDEEQPKEQRVAGLLDSLPHLRHCEVLALRVEPLA